MGGVPITSPGRALLLAIATAASLASPPAAADDGPPRRADARRALAVVDGLVGRDEPGLALLVRRGGKSVLARGWGLRDLRGRAAVDARTGFRLASMTKPFTAMAVTILVRDGKLRYDTPLTDVLPSFPAYGRGITIRHLLTHTSGLPAYEDLMADAVKAGAPPWTAERQIHDDEVLGLLRGARAGRFEPGTSWAYSNSGYVLLGLVVARVSGQPFGDFLAKRVFRPLGMDRTVAYEAGKNEVPARAFGHEKEGGSFIERDQSPTSATLGDGGVYSSLDDLAKWDEALRTSALLSAGAMKPALEPATLPDGTLPRWPAGEPGGDDLAPGERVAYGFGWFLDPWRGRRRSWHHGETVGFRSVVERFPDDGLTVIVLANRGDLDVKKVALDVADAVLSASPDKGTP
jgi:CubicO group peptidase (beta-lactamase class C family)